MPWGSGEDLNIKAVLLDTAADAAVATGVAATGTVITITQGWYWLDPAVALAIRHRVWLPRRRADLTGTPRTADTNRPDAHQRLVAKLRAADPGLAGRGDDGHLDGLDAIEQAIWTRQREGVLDLKDVVHHTDRESQYTSIRFSERLAEAGIQPSVGAAGSCDNALAETINGLYKTELIKPGKPWRSIEDVELATARWIDWFNHRRLYE